MPIIRGPRPTSNFYLLDKRISEDKSLSWSARGLLIYLLGKPDHWKVSVAALVNETKLSSKPSGRDGVYSLLKELIVSGYLVRSQNKKDGGFHEVDYLVNETPANPVNSPLTALPDTDEPDTANPIQVSIDVKQVMNKAKEEQKASLGDVVDLYHQILGDSLPNVKTLTSSRRSQLSARQKDYPKAKDIGWWQIFFESVLDRPFLLGYNDREWSADLDFLLSPKGFAGVIEGKY
jgi:hypothetical protein